MESSSSSSSPEISHSSPAFDPAFFSYASLDEVLEELSTRFIMNLPDQELESVERICFQVEQAHWYYEDFMREANPKLPSLNLKKFSSIFFKSCPLLRQWSAEHEQYFNTFMQYKVRVPVCGAIMLNDKWDKCLLVKGWKSSAGWGFPKGKINQNEPAHECAAREVAEETGFNISSYIRSEDYIEMTIREQRVTLFIVGGIPEDYPFQTRTRKEISKIQWFKLSDLPSWKRNKQVPGKFYLISPFVHALKEFIRVNKPIRGRQNRRKNGDDVKADLTIRTAPERDDAPDHNGHYQQTSIRAVSLDRDVHGYSSSSVDNGEPQTPSPQSTEAVPVMTEVDGEGKSDVPMDPHFARLLNGLTLSASKPSINEAEVRASSITPTSAQSSLASGREEPGNILGQSNISSGEDAGSPAVQSSASSGIFGSSNVKSPSESARSDCSATTVRPQSAQPTSSPGVASASATDRRIKHLALLESVAQELASSTPAPGVHQLTHPRPPSSVPPLLFNSGGPINSPAAPPLVNGPHALTQFNAANRPAVPTSSDPFSVRPMTSQAVFPPPPSVRRHDGNMDVHQGALLSILSGPSNTSMNGPGPLRRKQLFGAVNGNSTAPFAGPVQPGTLVPPTRIYALAPQPLRVMPPPPGSFQHNPGPLSAPLVPGQPRPFFPQPGANNVFTSHKAPPPNATQLLSLLNSTRPASTVAAGSNPLNIPTGSLGAPPQ